MLGVLSFCDGERASIKITALTFLMKKQDVSFLEYTKKVKSCRHIVKVSSNSFSNDLSEVC